MTEKPAPPVPADADLRDFAFMPLDVVRLRDSELAAMAGGEEFRAAVLLWCAAWHQVPAASLPNDERAIAMLAGFGRDLKGWRKVSAQALRGFSLHSDGRLYHHVVAEKAKQAWDEKQGYRARREQRKQIASNAARARWSSEGDAKSNASSMHEASAEHAVEHPPSNAERDRERDSKERTTLRVDAEASSRSIAEEVKAALFGPCLRYLAKSMPVDKARSVIGKWRRDFGDVDAAAAIAEAEKASASQPVEFIVAVLQRRSANRGRPDPNGPPRLATAI